MSAEGDLTKNIPEAEANQSGILCVEMGTSLEELRGFQKILSN